MGRFRKSTHGRAGFSTGTDFEHWYRDNTVYFITARCRDRFPAFATEQAKLIFWDRFEHWTSHYGFDPFVATVLENHYHFEGYLEIVRARIARDWRDYPHTRVYVELADALQRARELDVYLEEVEYKRYKDHRKTMR